MTTILKNTAPVSLTVGNIGSIQYGDDNYGIVVKDFLSGLEVNVAVDYTIATVGGTGAVTSRQAIPSRLSFDRGFTLGFGAGVGSNWSWIERDHR